MIPVMHRHGGVDWPDASACALCKEQAALVERDVEIARLRDIFDRAPHLFGCAGWNGISWSMRECDCWKREALGEEE